MRWPLLSLLLTGACASSITSGGQSGSEVTVWEGCVEDTRYSADDDVIPAGWVHSVGEHRQALSVQRQGTWSGPSSDVGPLGAGLLTDGEAFVLSLLDMQSGSACGDAVELEGEVQLWGAAEGGQRVRWIGGAYGEAYVPTTYARDLDIPALEVPPQGLVFLQVATDPHRTQIELLEGEDDSIVSIGQAVLE